jgi:hypothetical protein
MDCRTARLFLHFNRPGGSDLDGPEAEELSSHLSHCTECNALARADRRLDGHLGRAMRAVEVPQGLRREILHRLAAERGDWYRRWFARGGRILTGAAALLLIAWGAFALWAPKKRLLDAETFAYEFNVAPPRDVARVNALLANLGAKRCAPDFVNYSYLTGVPALAAAPGYEKIKAPQLVFTRWETKDGRRQGQAETVVIFPIDTNEYELGELENSTHGYKYRLEVYRRSPGARFAYLILYTGESWKWLEAPARSE